MGLFPVPQRQRLLARHLYRALPGLAAALCAVLLIAACSPVRADDGTAPDGAAGSGSGQPVVDVHIVNGDLLAVVNGLHLQCGAQFMVRGGSKSYRPVNLTLKGTLPTVLNYVAESAGATVTRGEDGVYVLRPESETPAAPAQAADAPVAQTVAASADTGSGHVSGPMHWERMHLRYVRPVFILTMLNDTQDMRDTNPLHDPNDKAAYGPLPGSSTQTMQNSVYIPQTGFTPAPGSSTLYGQPANTPQQEQPSVPLGNNGYGAQNTLSANRVSSSAGNQAQQFAPPGGFNPGGFNPGGFNPGGAAPQNGQNGQNNQASLRPQGIEAIIANTEDNSLLVRGDTDGIQELRQIISQLDRPSRQVQIRAEFVTATVSEIDQFGINFTLIPFPNISTSFNGVSAAQSGGASTNVQFAQGNLVGQLYAQLSTGNSRVVSAPLITTTNGTPGSINVTQQIPFVTSTTSVSGSGTATTGSTVAFLSVTSSLTVTPHIVGDNYVQVTINLPNSSTTPSQGGLPPAVTTQTVTTTRTVMNGETMVLAGLVSNTDTAARVKVPFLGDLPVIGNLFRTRNTNNADSELLVFITPTILPDIDTSSTESSDQGGSTTVGVTP